MNNVLCQYVLNVSYIVINVIQNSAVILNAVRYVMHLYVVNVMKMLPQWNIHIIVIRRLSIMIIQYVMIASTQNNIYVIVTIVIVTIVAVTKQYVNHVKTCVLDVEHIKLIQSYSYKLQLNNKTITLT